MGLRVNTNLASLTARRNLYQVGARLQGNYSHLSSGLRIAHAADDASGLGISERMRAQVRGLDAAARNAQDGISMLQTAEGGLGEISNLLTRMRELAVQSASGAITRDERVIMNGEFQKLKNEIDRTAKLEFNGKKLLNNNALQRFQVGVNNGERIDVANVDVRTVALGIASNGVGTVANANASMTNLDVAVQTVANHRGSRGAAVNRLESARASLLNASTNLAAAESRIRDLDVANETTALSRNTIVREAAVAVLAQANVQGKRALTLLGPGVKHGGQPGFAG